MAVNNLSPEQEEKVIGHVTSYARQIHDSTQRLRKTWLVLYKNYRRFRTEGKKAWQSKLWIPKTFEVIEKIAARTTAHNPRFFLKALQPSALEEFTINQDEIDEALARNKEAELDEEVTPLPVPQPLVMQSKDVFRSYLDFVWREQGLNMTIKLWDKDRLIYGSSHVKIES